MILDFRIRNAEFRRTRRRGFSFVEVLFAVMILGIGFIMLAGIFPVALSQSQATADDTIGAAVARGGVEYLANMKGSLGVPPDGRVYRMEGANWDLIKGNLILPEDPRYAWVPFLRAPAGASYAQAIVIAVRSRNKSAYTPTLNDNGRVGPVGDIALTENPQIATLMGRAVKFTTDIRTKNVNDPDPVDTVTFDTSGDFAKGAQAVAPGTFLVISTDVPATSGPNANGWILRIGNLVNGSTWELLPGGDFKGASYFPASGAELQGFVVGQAFNPATNSFDGGTQDIAAYTSFIRLR